MKRKGILYILIALLISFNAFAQTEPKITIALLENDKIADINVDQEKFTNAIGEILNLAKEEFKDIDESQKIAILIINHKAGTPTIEFYANPKISDEQENQFLQKLKSLPIENTKVVDFPILMLINSKFVEYKEDFKELITPFDKRYNEYINADLKKKYELNIDYAIEVLSILNAYLISVDDQFVGVKNFGKLVTATNFSEKQDIAKLTSENSDYWRAILEMTIGNQLISTTKIFMLISQGEFDYALKYIEVISAFSNSKSIPDKYLNELIDRLDLFNEQLNKKVQEGIVYHDMGKYAKAISVYKELLKNYPNSAWTKYELYYSQNALSLENKTIELNDRSDWDNAKLGIYKSNPIYNMDVRANNGKEAYLLFRRVSISELFKNSKNRLSDIYTYADIAMDLEVYDFAAQLFWISVTFDKKNNDAPYKFLYCIEKLGVTNLKDVFKGNSEKEFKKIEKNKEKEMIKSKTYKSFKK